MNGEPDRGGETAGDPPAPVAVEPGIAGSREQASETGWRVRLPTFEGPLDLLLHLIQQNEIDIRDIPISFITEKYVEYITLMQTLNIDVASEYLVMAATLAHIKSKMLLPTPPEDQEDAEDEDEIDPRGELVRRLLEYQKYKQAAGQLAARSVLGRDVFLRGVAAPSVDGPSPLAPLSLFKLLDAFQSVLDRARINVDHEIDLERFSITDRINELSDVLRRRPRLRFDELFAGARSRGDLIITFLALLEMTRLRLTRLSQDAPLAPILVELAVSEETEPVEAGEQEAGAALYAGVTTGVDARVPGEGAPAGTARAPRPPDAVEAPAPDTRDEPPGTEPE